METEAWNAIDRDDAEPVRRFLEQQLQRSSDQGEDAMPPLEEWRVWRVVMKALRGDIINAAPPGVNCNAAVAHCVCEHPLSRGMIERYPTKAMNAALLYDRPVALREVIGVVGPNHCNGFPLRGAIMRGCATAVEVLLSDPRTDPNLSPHPPSHLLSPIRLALDPSRLLLNRVNADIVIQLLVCPRLRIEGETLNYVVEHIEEITERAMVEHNLVFIRPLLDHLSVRAAVPEDQRTQLLAMIDGTI